MPRIIACKRRTVSGLTYTYVFKLNLSLMIITVHDSILFTSPRTLTLLDLLLSAPHDLPPPQDGPSVVCPCDILLCRHFALLAGHFQLLKLFVSFKKNKSDGDRCFLL